MIRHRSWIAPLALAAAPTLALAQQPNVLFIAVDDLRPQLNCYGNSVMQSPNIDGLAARGVMFDRAYCMVPVCGASRAAMLTGMRPTRDRFTSYKTSVDEDAPDVVTLNQQFHDHGYVTLSLGKIYHNAGDNREGWSDKPWMNVPVNRDYQDPANRQTVAEQNRGPAYENYDAPEENYNDGKLAKKAVQTLRDLKGSDKPWFLAVGFFKPHLPFIAPRKYWDLYEESDVTLPDTYGQTPDAPPAAIHDSGELRNYHDVPKGKEPITPELGRKLVHGYYASVSFVDAQIGKVLDELEALGMADNTIIVLWGDHGYQLGEHEMWTKHTCFEISMRVPLIVVDPRDRQVAPGTRTPALVESIDIFPTLCELAGLPLPEHLEGRSFAPVMRQPQLPWKSAAIGRIGNGDTIRTDRYRYAEYRTDDGRDLGSMLFDDIEDPLELDNIVDEADAEHVAALSRDLAEIKTDAAVEAAPVH